MQHTVWCKFLTESAKRQDEIFIFEVLMTTQHCSSKSFILCLYMKTISAKKVKVHFAYFVHHGIMAKNLT